MKIPKSGKKIFTYKGVTLFFRSIKGILLVYEAEHQFLIMATTKDRNKAMEIIVSRWKEIEDEINRRGTEEGQ